jgi:hypothetical protein
MREAGAVLGVVRVGSGMTVGCASGRRARRERARRARDPRALGAVGRRDPRRGNRLLGGGIGWVGASVQRGNRLGRSRDAGGSGRAAGYSAAVVCRARGMREAGESGGSLQMTLNSCRDFFKSLIRLKSGSISI